ncbi:unnamed protein product [Protopolystoma xenopodis]|uniref:Uncharacterized protein n=1 Tax=Protopolystoma xenopodis TaxID=117903 RepID=A0A3S5AJ55_9PLAT|nr:unnamed protein product [Protopolystoma xenopodis]
MHDETGWLYYLVQPSSLLSHFIEMNDAKKTYLLREFLSQAEICDRRSSQPSLPVVLKRLAPLSNISASKSDSSDLCDAFRSFDAENIDLSQNYSKSRVLDTLALQTAAELKFNVNLFSITAEIPIRLLARLYRIFISSASQMSRTNSDDLLAGSEVPINPYDVVDWASLHPLTLYAVMIYHLWCLQVCF